MIEVLATPPLNTVQDLGRQGYRHLGLGESGAMDDVALSVGNLLLGNPPGAAGIEIQMFPFSVRLGADTAIAVTGAGCRPNLGSRVLPPWWSVAARAGQVLTLGAPAKGARTYLAVRGGIDVPVVLGSRSTNLRTGFGGHEGRAVQAGDVLRACALDGGGRAAPDATGFGVAPPDLAITAPLAGAGDLSVRVLPGPEHDLFSTQAVEAFWNGQWRVTPQSDRMGMRLRGESLAIEPPVEVRSGGIVVGVVQVPPSGDPIIQLRDANSAGGYPRIGVVARADLWRLAQVRPGQSVRFVHVDHDAALAAEDPVRDYLQRVRILSRLCRLRPGELASVRGRGEG